MAKNDITPEVQHLAQLAAPRAGQPPTKTANLPNPAIKKAALDAELAGKTLEERVVRAGELTIDIMGTKLQECINGNELELSNQRFVNGTRLDPTKLCLARFEYSAEMTRDPSLSENDRLLGGLLSPYRDMATRRRLPDDEAGSQYILDVIYDHTSHPKVEPRKVSTINFAPVPIPNSNPPATYTPPPINTVCGSGFASHFAHNILLSQQNPNDPSIQKKPTMSREQIAEAATACFAKPTGTDVNKEIGLGNSLGTEFSLHVLRERPAGKKSFASIVRGD